MIKTRQKWMFAVLLIVCLSLWIAACGKPTETKPTSLSIANKEALTAEWLFGGADRTVEVSLTPDSFTLENTQVTVTSGNTAAVTVSGMTLKAVGAGTSVITVSAGELKDEVTVTVKPVLSGVSITNKEALTAEWLFGGADRTVEVSLTPDSFTLENTQVTVTSGNTAAVTVSGMTLKAVGAGTSVITVSAGELKDEVTVTVKPVLSGVSITNKEALTAEWVEGDADRTVEVSLTPDSFTLENTQVTVTSANPEVVEVSGMTLKAAGAGTSVITVSAGEFTDTVELTVRPALESVQVSNKDALTAQWIIGSEDRTVEVALSPSEYYNTQNTQVTVTSENPDAVEVSGMTLRAVGAGTSVITVSAGDKNDTFTVSVEIGAPQITVAKETIEVLQDTPAYLLEGVTVKSCDGSDLKSSLSVELSDPDKMTYSVENLTVSEPGAYTVTFTVSDPRDASKTASKTVDVDVYRKIFTWQDNTWTVGNEMRPNTEQTVAGSNTGFTIAQFNLSPSTLYYAEAVYTVGDPHGGRVIGMGHFAEGNTSRWLAMCVDRGDRNHKAKDFDTTDGKSWDLNEHDAYGRFCAYSYQIANYRGIPDKDAGVVKYAIARSGDYFYTFVNDTYVCCVSLEYYRDQPTLPGIFGHAMDTTVLSSIVYFGGEQAQQKLDSLLADGSQMGAYVPDNWASASLNDNLKINPISETRGLNYDYTDTMSDFNNGMAGPYLYLDGDFTFSWEYKNTGIGDTANQRRMILEVRNFLYGAEIVQFGADLANNKYLLNVSQKESWWEQTANFPDEEKGTRYTISRRVMDGYDEYTMTVQSLDDPELTFTRTVQWDGKNSAGGVADDKVGRPVLFVWHNYFTSGEYSNITWSIDDAQA